MTLDKSTLIESIDVKNLSGTKLVLSIFNENLPD